VCGRVQAFTGTIMGIAELLREYSGAVMGMYGHCYGRVPVGAYGRLRGAIVGVCRCLWALLWACAGAI